MLNKKITSTTGRIALGIAALVTLSVTGQALAAKGSGGGRTFDVAITDGNCILANNAVDPLAKPSMVIRSSQGVNYFIMQVVGSNSVGTWDIRFTKDGVAGNTYSNFVVPPPGGWAVTGGSVAKGAKSLQAVGVARNLINGTVCTASISRVF